MHDEIISNLEKVEFIFGTSARAKAAFTTDLDFIFDSDEWKKILTDATKDTFYEHALETAIRSGSLVDVQITEIDDWLANVLDDAVVSSTNQISDSIDTIKEDIQKVIRKEVDSNPFATKDEIFDKIVSEIDYKFNEVYTESRARAIATTTVTSNTGAVQSQTWKGLGFTYEWLTERDDRVRPTHEKMDGVLVGVDGKFRVPKPENEDDFDVVEHPAGVGLSASNAVNCRCQLFPVRL